MPVSRPSRRSICFRPFGRSATPPLSSPCGLAASPQLSASEVPLVRAPLHGEHSADVLQEDLGLSDEDIRALLDAGVLVSTVEEATA